MIDESCPPPPTDDDAPSNVVQFRRSSSKRSTLSPAALARHPTWLDTEFSDEFFKRHGKNVRYVSDAQSWLWWTGQHWNGNDAGLGVFRLAETFTKEMVAEQAQSPCPEGEEEEIERAKAVARLESRLSLARIESLVQLTRARPGITLQADDINRKLSLLSVGNGTINLKTGELSQYRREDYCTHVTQVSYVSDALCPRWEEFLDHAFHGSHEMIDFMQRLCGYALTGETREQKLFFIYGVGGRGKSTFMETLAAILGKHAHAAPQEFIEVTPTSPHPTMLASTHGKRLVFVSETRQGKVMDVTRVKQFTGEDVVTARRMRQDEFNFRPIAKLFVVGNHKPVITEVDEAIWRRMVLIGFERDVPKVDPRLREALLEELPGILAWCVRGAVAWYQHGLMVPDSIKQAVKDYREEQDNFGAFVRDCLIVDPAARVKSTELSEVYRSWCKENGCAELGRRELTPRFARLGVSRQRIRFVDGDNVNGWLGVRIRRTTD